MLVPAAYVQGRAEHHGLLDSGQRLQTFRQGVQTRPGHGQGRQPLRGHNLLGRAGGQQLARGNTGQLVAAFGPVHVVRADQDRNAAGRQPVQLVPEIPARHGVNACGGFVQKQQFRLVQHAGRKGEPLLPAAGQRSGQLLGPAAKPHLFHGRRHRGPAFFHLEEPGHKMQILADAQVVPKGEFLGHVADPAFDGGAFPQNVKAQTGAAAGIRGQKAAHQADARGLAAPVRAKEAIDFALFHPERDPVHHQLSAEALAQIMHVNGSRILVGFWHGLVSGGRLTGLLCGAMPLYCSSTCTGWPGCSRPASAGSAGLASTMKTSLLRVSLL